MADFSINTAAPNYADELAMLGVTGALNYAPKGTELPTAIAKLEAPYVDLGWISDAGLSESLNQERNDWTPWQANNPIRGQVTQEDVQFTVTLWSISGLANALYYGVPESDMVFDEETGVTTFEQGKELPEDFKFALVIDIVDGKKSRRFAMPNVTVAERGEITYGKEDLVGYELTLRASFDAKAGFSIRRMFNEGWKPGTSGSTLAGKTADASLGEWHKDVNGEEDPGVPEASATGAFNIADATGGTYTISVGEHTTSSLNYDDNASTIQSALRAAGESAATVSGTRTGGFTISKVSQKPTVNGESLTGGSYADSGVTVS